MIVHNRVDLSHARTQMINGDHDVFGDGTVVLKIGHSTAFFRDAIKSPGWYE